MRVYTVGELDFDSKIMNKLIFIMFQSLNHFYNEYRQARIISIKIMIWKNLYSNVILILTATLRLYIIAYTINFSIYFLSLMIGFSKFPLFSMFL